MQKPRAYSYIRMSTDAQLKGDSLRRQLELSQKYAAAHGLEIVPDLDLKDLGVSAYTGDNISTGALGRFLASVAAGDIPIGSYLLVESLDRLSREEPRLALPRFLDIVNAGIVLVTLADNRKYTLGNCRLEDLLYSLVVMSRAHDESATKSHRLSSAWKHKRQTAGQRKLTALCPAWLTLSADKTTFATIKERQAVIETIFSSANSGMGAYSIARMLNRDKVPAFKGRDGWHTSSINKLLTNRAVIGEFQPHRMIRGRRIPEGQPLSNYFPAIISEDMFYSAQAQRAERRVSGGGRRGEFVSNLFSKLARCHYCRGPMRFENKGSGEHQRTFLVCNNAVRAKRCQAIRWNYQEFEASFLAFVEEIDLGSFFSSARDAQERAAIEPAIASLKARIEKLATEQANAYALLEFKDADIPYVFERLRESETALETCKQELAALAAKLQRTSIERASYYESKDDLKDLIAQIGSRGTPEAYKLRAKIAARLRSVITSLTLSPGGGLPVASWDSAPPVENDPSYKADLVMDEPRRGRYFTVCFRDGRSRTVFPTDADAFAFHQQVAWIGSEPHLIEGEAGLTALINLDQFRPQWEPSSED